MQYAIGDWLLALILFCIAGRILVALMVEVGSLYSASAMPRLLTWDSHKRIGISRLWQCRTISVITSAVKFPSRATKAGSWFFNCAITCAAEDFSHLHKLKVNLAHLRP